MPRASDQETPEAWRERGVQLCYHVLGAVQHLEDCEAVPRVKDYIAFPKPNGYQSLHASVLREPEDQVVEIQIRTRGMHEVAEYGMAAHWLYKDGLLEPGGEDATRRALCASASAAAVAEKRPRASAKPTRASGSTPSRTCRISTVQGSSSRRSDVRGGVEFHFNSGPSPRHRCE